MVDTPRTNSYLLTSEFQDGQAPASISAQRMRDLIVTFNSRAPVSIKQFGAIGDGVTDDTAAFQAAITYAKTQSRTVLTGDTTMPQLIGVKIYIPHGDYLIKTAKAMLDFDFGVLANAPYGLAFEGESFGGTTIVYQPTSSGPLCYNNACLARIEFNNLSFFCNDANSDFFDSIGPRAQTYSFNHCHWIGTWKYGLQLTGTDNNAEMQWNQCVFLGTFTYFLYGNSTTADQFLNFWFTNCSILNSCTLIYSDTAGGGHYHLINCDFSGWAPSVDTYVAQLLGTYRSQGVTSFSAINCRMEARNLHALFLKCEWGFGSVLLENCDFGAYAFGTGIGFSPFYFNPRSLAGPTIRFDSCSLMGRHEYHYADKGFGESSSGQATVYSYSIVYESCTMMQSSVPSDFIIQTNDGTAGNVGNSKTIKFRNCVSNITGNPVIWDTDLNWNVSSIGSTDRKIVSPKTLTGAFPKSGQSVTVYLPTGAIVTNITWFSAGTGGNTSAFFYRVRSTEGSPTILDSVSGANLSLGFNRSTALFFDCGTNALRTTLIFDETASQATAPTVAYCCIEYIG